MGYNRLILEGNLVEDPTLRYSQSGTAMASSKIAVNQKFKKQDGTQGEEVLFLKINFYSRSAEIFNQYCRKGSRILVEGKLKNENWTANDGSKRYDFSMKVENMQMLDSRNDAPGASTGSYDAQQEYSQPQGGYNAPQPQYQQPSRPQQQYKPQSMPENTIPEIDIDEGEIPF